VNREWTISPAFSQRIAPTAGNARFVGVTSRIFHGRVSRQVDGGLAAVAQADTAWALPLSLVATFD
jgi:hypothetical protein